MITNTQRVKINSEMNEKRRTDEAINIIKEETDKSEIPMVATTIRRKKNQKQMSNVKLENKLGGTELLISNWNNL